MNAIQDLFSRVADKYDVMNDVMSLSLHRLWKKRFVDSLLLKPDISIIDVACGSGDIIALLLKRLKKLGIKGHITGFDPNPNMVKKAQEKLVNQGLIEEVEWIIGSAEELPFPDKSFDLYTVSFGLRNITHKDKALQEAYRVLKPMGQLGCLEFSKPTSLALNFLYKPYLSAVIPQLGKWIAFDEEAYRYLAESIKHFENQKQVQAMMEKAGFPLVCIENVSGGIAAIHRAWR